MDTDSRRNFLRVLGGFAVTGLFVSEFTNQIARAESQSNSFVDWLYVVHTNAVYDFDSHSIFLPVRSAITGRDGLLAFEINDVQRPKLLLDLGFLPPVSAILGLGDGLFALGGTQIVKRTFSLEITGDPPYNDLKKIHQLAALNLDNETTTSTVEIPSSWAVQGSIGDFERADVHSWPSLDSTFLLGVSRKPDQAGFISWERNDFARVDANNLNIVNGIEGIKPLGELVGEAGQLSILMTTNTPYLSVSGPSTTNFFELHEQSWSKFSELAIGEGFLITVAGMPYFASISPSALSIELFSLLNPDVRITQQLNGPCELLLPVAGREDLAVIILADGSIQTTSFEAGGK